MATGSSHASTLAMAENTAPTIRSAAALVMEVSAATWETSSALVRLAFPRAVIGLRWMGRVQIRRAASAKATQPAVREGSGRTDVDEPVMSASTRATARQLMRANARETPEPSSIRMQVDSTGDDVERSGDGRSRVERERRRDLVTLPRTRSNPRRLTAPRPGFPAGLVRSWGTESRGVGGLVVTVSIRFESGRSKSTRVACGGGSGCLAGRPRGLGWSWWMRDGANASVFRSFCMDARVG